MAYCDKCGAYIPDGQTKCLACGYDAEEEAKKAAAEKRRAKVNKSSAASGAAAQRGRDAGMNNEELRARLEEQRRRQQEQSRIWAERERERREQSRAQQERERESRRENYGGDYSGAGYTGQSDSGMDFSRQGSYYADKDSRLFAVLSYFSFLFLIPMIFRRDDDFAMFHAKQGLVLLIFGVVADVLSAIPVIGWMFPLFRVYCVISGVSAAAKRQRRPLPYIGRFAEYFKF